MEYVGLLECELGSIPTAEKIIYTVTLPSQEDDKAVRVKMIGERRENESMVGMLYLP